MIAITTSSSISVKPAQEERMASPPIMLIAEDIGGRTKILAEPDKPSRRNPAQSARIRIANSLHDRELAPFEKLGGAGQARMQAYRVADLEQAVGGEPQGLAVLGVAVILVRDDRVDAVVAAVELDDHQDVAVAVGSGRACRRGQESGA